MSDYVAMLQWQTRIMDDLAALREQVRLLWIQACPIKHDNTNNCAAPCIKPAPEREERWDDKYGRYFVPPAPRKEGIPFSQTRPPEEREVVENLARAFVPPRPEAQGEKDAQRPDPKAQARERRTWTIAGGRSAIGPYPYFVASQHNPEIAFGETVTVVEVFPGETLAPVPDRDYAWEAGCCLALAEGTGMPEGEPPESWPLSMKAVLKLRRQYDALAPQQEGPYPGPDPQAQGERVRVHETDLFHQCDEPKCPLRHYVAVILPEGGSPPAGTAGSAAKEKP